MDSSDAIQFIVLIILLFLSGFFSSAETALTTVSKITMRSMADDGDKRAALVLDVIENQKTKMLSAILIGNNIVNISASSLATTLAYSFGGYMVSIVTAVLTVLILVFGEITPKSMATLRAVKFSLLYQDHSLFNDDPDTVHFYCEFIFTRYSCIITNQSG